MLPKQRLLMMLLKKKWAQPTMMMRKRIRKWMRSFRAYPRPPRPVQTQPLLRRPLLLLPLPLPLPLPLRRARARRAQDPR